jgi:hypothetical protein
VGAAGRLRVPGRAVRASLGKSFDVEEARVAHWEGSSLLDSQVTTTTKNWRDYISERDANLVEELLGPELARFGYLSAVR